MKNRNESEWVVIGAKAGWYSGWMRLDSNFIYHQMLAGERHVYDLFASAIEKSQSIEPASTLSSVNSLSPPSLPPPTLTLSFTHSCLLSFFLSFLLSLQELKKKGINREKILGKWLHVCVRRAPCKWLGSTFEAINRGPLIRKEFPKTEMMWKIPHAECLIS